MKKLLFLFAALIPVSFMAQVNDMFYVPKKSVKTKSVADVVSASQDADEWGIADNGNGRDVDEYNRRGSYSASGGVKASEVESILSASQAKEQEYSDYVVDDYSYSTRIVRFHNPTTVVVSSPWYWDIYGPAYYYSPYYDSFWDWNWSFHFGSRCGFYSSLCWPHWNYSWHPHHASYHHHYEPVYSRSVNKRIPVADRRNGIAAGSRPAVGTAVQNGNRRPVAQKGGNAGKVSDRNMQKTNSSDKRKERTGRVAPAVRKESEQRRSAGSTYNRPSSTSVHRSPASNTGNRSSSGGSRGGVQRGSSRGR